MYQDVVVSLKNAAPSEVQVLASQGRACYVGDAGQLVIHHTSNPQDVIAVYAAGEWRSVLPVDLGEA